jgi:hypothetical protein
MHNKLVMCQTITDEEVKELRTLVVQKLSNDLEALSYKFKEVSKVMERTFNNA